MSEYVYAGTGLPAYDKTNARDVLAGFSQSYIAASEWNSLVTCVTNLKSALLSGAWHGLGDGTGVAVSASGLMRIRQVGGVLQISYNGGAYADLALTTDIPESSVSTGLTGVTAYAGGGQASATALTADVNFVTTCATDGDSVKLPAASLGKAVVVYNGGSKTCAVYPQSGGVISSLATNGGFYIPSGATKVFYGQSSTAWKTELYTGEGGWVDARDAGILTTNTSTQNTAAWDALMLAMDANVATSRGKAVRFPYGTFLFKTLRVTRSCHIEGCGGAGEWNGTVLQIDAGYDGICIEGEHVSSDGGFADKTTITNLCIQAYDKTTTAHGVRMNAVARVSNVKVKGFKSDGIHIVADTATLVDATAWPANTAVLVGDRCTNDSGKGYTCIQAGTTAASGGPTGISSSITDGTAVWRYSLGTNANGWFLDNCIVSSNGGNGLYVQGGDSNAGIATGCTFNSNDGWGVWDYSFLGNTYVGCETHANTTGPYKSNGTNARNMFLGCYSESGQNASEIAAPASVMGGIHAAGLTGTGYFWVDGEFSTATYQRTYGTHYIKSGGDDLQQVDSDGATFPIRLKHYAAGTNDIATESIAWNWANSGNYTGHGIALENCVINSNAPKQRWVQATQLFTGHAHGLINEGQRISHSDDPTATPSAYGYRTYCVGDLVFKRTPTLDGSPGWCVTTAGSVGTYTEGRTATSSGGSTLALSAATSLFNLSGLHVGDWVTVGGSAATRITAVSSNGLTLTVSSSIGAGSGLAIAFSPPVFTAMPRLAGGAGNSTGSPGNATLNTSKGRSAFAAGANSVTITNSLVTDNTIIAMPVLQTLDASLTQILAVICTTGSFTVYGNANATATTNFGWHIVE